jgi:pimeloyl-ACP methyl ester carboxylesterase
VKLVWGEDDTDVPVGVARAAASFLADAEITVVPGAGHFTPLTASADLRTAIEPYRP